MTFLRSLGRVWTGTGLLVLAGSLATVSGQSVSVVYVPNAGSGNVSGYTINTTTGALTPTAGSPYSEPNTTANAFRAAVTPNHSFLYISNRDSDIAGYKINTDGSLTSIPGANKAVTTPTGIAVDPSGKFLYVAQNPVGTDGSVSGFSIDPATGNLTALGGSPFGLGTGNRGAQSIAVSGNFLYVVLALNNAVELVTINPSTGALTPGALTPLPFSDILPGPINVTAPFDVKIDGSNHLYVSDAGYFAGAGAVAGLAAFTINSGTGGLSATTTPTYATGVNPAEIAIDPQSRFLYTANNNGGVAGSVSAFTINSGTGNLTAVTGSPFTIGGNSATGAAVDVSGNFLYVTAAGSNSVAGLRIAQSGTPGALTFLASTAAGTSPALLLSTVAPAAPATPPASVPAASTWSMMALGVLLAGFSGLLYRRAYR
jgi:6-phosphogluconolactonase (cycloisomerase 2 family)